MSPTRPAPTAPRRPRSPLLAVSVVVTVLVAVLGCRSLTQASAVAPPRVAEPLGHSSGVAGGRVPDGTTAFDDTYPAVANLDPALLGALREATRDAAGDGVTLHVNSGWRSAAYQEQLLDDAVTTYGSRAEAARWVATPATSPHVSGDAVDIGGSEAMAWLSRRGAAHGLCQVFGNEPWHFELRPDAVGDGCPTPYPDPTHDPRMRG